MKHTILQTKLVTKVIRRLYDFHELIDIDIDNQKNKIYIEWKHYIDDKTTDVEIEEFNYPIKEVYKDVYRDRNCIIFETYSHSFFKKRQVQK